MVHHCLPGAAQKGVTGTIGLCQGPFQCSRSRALQCIFSQGLWDTFRYLDAYLDTVRGPCARASKREPRQSKDKE